MMQRANLMLSFDALTFQTARAALEQGCEAIRAGQTVFDLASVKAADSSAVAVLLAWQRAAREAGLVLSYRNLPESVRSLATLYGVDAFLGASPADLHHH
jgi:phospholipid transport system transporter-binding protein